MTQAPRGDLNAWSGGQDVPPQRRRSDCDLESLGATAERAIVETEEAGGKQSIVVALFLGRSARHHVKYP
ncbi:unnamed protein product [Boreogadus saida]